MKSNEIEKIKFTDATNFYGHSMSQILPYDEIEMWHGHPDVYMNKLEDILKTPNDNGIGFFIEVDLKYPDKIKTKTKNSPFVPENKTIDKNECGEYKKKRKLKNYEGTKKLICDWSDKKKFLTDNRMLKFYVRHGMIVEKIHERFLFKQSKW